eukprot:CAMPEP_0201564510 /NCGR_PEP_ID=MMETSP0190_2-20130828/2846_1 /ASSEMBLY_ACC=CAM_ASM_000263 /TAXON_ID=37353 /ORGANISM="Rosalina sp." /LENGTH=283 /DNA_ID=CAMNT_0047980769 /DNA_START=24 /DNA_END=872 /DNA_ORIENTATION=+
MLALLFASILGLVYSADLPKGTLGIYCLIADDTVANYTSTSTWTPNLYDYQINGANVIFLTFLNPVSMPNVPPAMAALAKCKGQSGCPSASTPVIFSVGGYSYSMKAWPWLATQAAAESMAAEVATWDTKYGADGIDLDIETGPSGNSQEQSNNLVAFAKKLRELNPKFLITQPVFGYPQVTAENTMVNSAFKSKPYGVDSIGIMVYSGLNSLQYVKDYGNATSQWDGFPIQVDVPYPRILAGIQGSAASSTIQQMATSVVSEGIGGFMVWFASVKDMTRGGV